MNHKIFLSMSVMVIFFTACGGTQESQPKALVSQEQARRAFDIVADIDYIPFSYQIDGCYGRSLYMAMELAAEGIPSSALYMRGNLEPSAGIYWAYHVALLITTRDFDHAVILDPSLADEPLSLPNWVILADQLDPDPDYRYWLSQGSSYVDHEIEHVYDDSTSTLLEDDAVFEAMIKDFASMKPFVARDVSEACKSMKTYLRRSDLSYVVKNAKMMKLERRTKELVQILYKLHKIDSTRVTCW